MRFEISAKIVLKFILLVHVGLAILDLRFLILPWIYIGFHLWSLATYPLGAPWVPTSISNIKRMLKMAKIKPGEVLYDLGSGDGRIVIEAAKLRARAIGIEIDPIKMLISRLKLKLIKLDKHAEIKNANFFNITLNDADVVAMYLLPKTVNKLKTKFKRELKAGSRIVSLHFPLRGWKTIRVDKKNKIFVYKI